MLIQFFQFQLVQEKRKKLSADPLCLILISILKLIQQQWQYNDLVQLLFGLKLLQSYLIFASPLHLICLQGYLEINQLLASVEQQAKESNFSKSNDPYLMIRPKSDDSSGKTFAINYWSTCAEEGNDIKAGTLLSSKEDLFFMSNQITLMTNTVGGTKKQNNKDRILAYRNALLTHGRIVTFADIKALGFNHFKSTIEEIKIEKGTRKEISVKAGFSRTVDIHIKTNKEERELLSVTEWDYLCESFMKHLKSRSSNVFPYRLFIEN